LGMEYSKQFGSQNPPSFVRVNNLQTSLRRHNSFVFIV
jgi:hypothetical protein